MLAVSASHSWKGIEVVYHGDRVVSRVKFSDVTKEMLRTLAPQAVFSPVFSFDFDCIDLATLLHDIDFKGQYRAVATNLPNPALIEAEIQEVCPRLDFKIVS